MIGSLSGQVKEISGNLVLLEVQGVGYEVTCTRSCIEGLDENSKAASAIVIYTDVKEDSIRLFGFSDRLEKQIFILLLKVRGLGAKSASEVVSHVDKIELFRMIGSGDLGRLQMVKGIGKKLAERIIVELKDKVSEFAMERQGTSLASSIVVEPYSDAVAALQALGFTRRDAEVAVGQVRSHDPALSHSGEIVREALRYV